MSVEDIAVAESEGCDLEEYLCEASLYASLLPCSSTPGIRPRKTTKELAGAKVRFLWTTSN